MIIYTGEHPIGLWEVLDAALHRGLSLQGDFSRAFAPEVALAASLGYLSVIDTNGQTYRPQWRITHAGLSALENRGDYP